MTYEQTLNYCYGAMMHYEMEMNMHAMSEDAEKSIKKQLNSLWDYMYPMTEKYSEHAKEKLQRVKDRYGID